MYIFRRINKSTNECPNIFVALKSNKYFVKWINLSINIHIYLNIRISATYYIEVLNFNKISIFSTKVSEKIRYRWLFNKKKAKLHIHFWKNAGTPSCFFLFFFINICIKEFKKKYIFTFFSLQIQTEQVFENTSRKELFVTWEEPNFVMTGCQAGGRRQPSP